MNSSNDELNTYHQTLAMVSNVKMVDDSVLVDEETESEKNDKRLPAKAHVVEVLVLSFPPRLPALLGRDPNPTFVLDPTFPLPPLVDRRQPIETRRAEQERREKPAHHQEPQRHVVGKGKHVIRIAAELVPVRVVHDQ